MHVRVRVRVLASAFLLLLAFGGISGCKKDHRIEIQSDTCWDGRVNDTAGISGCNNKNYRIIGTMGCVKVQKQSVNGFLRIRVDGGAWSETSEQFGLVQICQ